MTRLSALLLVAACGDPSSTPPAARITTIAGVNSADYGYADGPAAEAHFNQPEGLALDAAGANLYIADSYNHVIRKLDLATKEVTTVAGVGKTPGSNDTDAGTPALLRDPRNLVLSSSGDAIYFTDTGNYTIRRLDLATSEVTTIAGAAGLGGSADGVGVVARFSAGSAASPWPGTIAIDGQIMYVADSANQTIRAVDLTTREVTTIAGVVGVSGHADGAAHSATFNKPSGLALDGTGALFIAEANNIDIRRLDLASGEVTTVAGKAPDDPNQYCESISPVLPPECGADDAVIGTDARFRFPFGVSGDGAGGMYIADSHNNLIRRFDMVTTEVTTVAGVQHTVLDDFLHESTDSTDTTPGTFWHPTHVLVGGPTTLYVADRSANCIRLVELPAD